MESHRVMHPTFFDNSSQIFFILQYDTDSSFRNDTVKEMRFHSSSCKEIRRKIKKIMLVKYI